MAYVDTTTEYAEFHGMMVFIKKCKPSHDILEAPTIYYEVVEEMWTSAEFDSGNKVLSFSLKGNDYFINDDVMNACFKILEHNIIGDPSSVDIVNMLNVIRYVGNTKIQFHKLIKPKSKVS